MDLDDVSAWNAAAEALLDGPAGCWDVRGVASWSHDLGHLGRSDGDAAFTGRVEDGVWSRFHAEGDAPLTPMLGQVRGLQVQVRDRHVVVHRSADPRVEPVNTVRDVLRALVGTEVVELATEAGEVRVERLGSTERRDAEVRTTVRFEAEAPVAMEVVLGEPYTHNLLATVRALDVSLRGQLVGGALVPASEQARFALRLPLWTIEAEQRLVYTHVEPCSP